MQLPPPLFADLMDVIVPIIIGTILIASKVLQKVAGNGDDDKPRPTPQRREARPQPAKGNDEAQRDLEEFLEDLGLRRENAAQEKQAPVREASTPRPRQAGRPVPPPPQPKRKPKRKSVRDRHLDSEIGERQATALESNVGQQRLGSRVGSRSLSSFDTAEPLVVAREVAATQVLSGEPIPMRTLLNNDGLLAQAFVLGEVLGPPLALRELRR